MLGWSLSLGHARHWPLQHPSLHPSLTERPGTPPNTPLPLQTAVYVHKLFPGLEGSPTALRSSSPHGSIPLLRLAPLHPQPQPPFLSPASLGPPPAPAPASEPMWEPLKGKDGPWARPSQEED